MNRHAAAIAIVLGSTMGAAADDAMPTFPLPAGTFKAPPPAGYCVANGQFESMARILASADNANLTDITYVACDDFTSGQLSSWGIIKTPLDSLRGKAGPRSAAIASLKASVNTEEGKQVMNLSPSDVADHSNLNKIFGPDFKGSAKFDALDSDDNGVYFGGVGNYDDGKGGVNKVAIAYAITVVNDAVFEIYLYKPFTDVSDIAALLAKVKPETAAFVAVNGG